MKIIFNQDFYNILINGKQMLNKATEILKTRLQVAYNCRVYNIKGGIKIVPLNIEINEQDLKQLIDSIIKELCSDDVKLLNELSYKDYFEIA